MAFHPLREALSRAGLRASHVDSTFKSQADAALERFQSVREDLERKVRRGDLTLKVAREKAAEAAAELKSTLRTRAEGFSPVPRAFLDRLVEASDARRRARELPSLESLQRETNRLLRQSLVEQQLVNRASEFLGRTSVRGMTGGKPAPTLASLLSFHETATQAGDETAREWARRQLEAMRSIVPDPDDQRRIDRACDRPESVNPRTVARYVEALADADSDAMERFVSEAAAERDANACVAAFIIARREPSLVASRWVRMVLQGLMDFPDAALEALRANEAEARALESDAAKAQADFAIALAESHCRLDRVEPPTEDELARQARVRNLPVAEPGEPIGLSLRRRGGDPDAEAASPSNDSA
ncbi:MAG: hypothetical protein AB7I30_04650 [Isosphaeraceae bacterium]